MQAIHQSNQNPAQGCIIQSYLLSPQQKRLWPFHQASGNAIFSAQCTVLIVGPIDVTALNAALREVVNRHQILRTTFHCLDGANIPVQFIEDPTPQVIRQCDWAHLPPRRRTQRLQRILREERDQPFNCEKGPIARWLLARLSANEYWLIITLSALCADSKGLNNLVRELSRSYAKLVGRETGAHVTPEDQLQYITASGWQNDLFE